MDGYFVCKSKYHDPKLKILEDLIGHSSIKFNQIQSYFVELWNLLNIKINVKSSNQFSVNLL